MLKLRYEIGQTNPDLRAAIAYDKLYIGEKLYEWQGDTLLCEGSDGLQALRTALGVDFSDQLRKLIEFIPPSEKGKP